MPLVVEGASNSCAQADFEFKILPKGGANANRMFGSSVTFVGDEGRTVAVGSGVDDTAVHM